MNTQQQTASILFQCALPMVKRILRDDALVGDAWCLLMQRCETRRCSLRYISTICRSVRLNQNRNAIKASPLESEIASTPDTEFTGTLYTSAPIVVQRWADGERLDSGERSAVSRYFEKQRETVRQN